MGDFTTVFQVCMVNSLFCLSLQSKNKYGTILISISLGIKLSGLVNSKQTGKETHEDTQRSTNNKDSFFFYTSTANNLTERAS